MPQRSTLSGRRILITGSTGLLAKVVLEKLIRSVPDIGSIAMLRAEVHEPEELARRLTELGIKEANYPGWNDTYTASS